MQLPIAEIRTAIAGAQALVKLGLEFIPGTTPEEDTAIILATVEPAVKMELDRLGVPAVVQTIALKFLEWAVASEVKAAAST